MGSKKKLTTIEMYNELVAKGVFVVSAMPAIFVLPTAYQYIPTHVVYSSTADKHAQLEPSSSRDQNEAIGW